MSYLSELSLRLAAGVERIAEEVRRRHAAFFRTALHADGGFTGREGGGDLYYTGFALRGLALIGELDEALAATVWRFLAGRLGSPMPSVDFLSLVSSAVLLELVTGNDLLGQAGDRRELVAARVRPFHRSDGGYAKTPRGPQSSTYHTFLVAACKQLVDARLDEASGMISLIRSRRRADGGFVELAQLRDSGTNPTAAGVGLLRLTGAMDEETRTAAAGFLAGMQNEEGGLRANTRIPVADLLSTFTGLVALDDLGGVAAVDPQAAARYVASLEQPTGGFRGGVWDTAADVEYTFYGLGTMALLNGIDVR